MLAFTLDSIDDFYDSDHLDFIPQSLPADDDHIGKLQPGVLVAWDDPYSADDLEDRNQGIGIIKGFGYRSWQDEYNGVLSAIIVNANPTDPYCEYIDFDHIDIVDMDDYLSLYEDFYEIENNEEVQALQRAVTSRIEKYTERESDSDMSRLLHHADFVQGRAS